MRESSLRAPRGLTRLSNLSPSALKLTGDAQKRSAPGKLEVLFIVSKTPGFKLLCVNSKNPVLSLTVQSK